MNFLHRNGETEPPTLNEGHFWFHPSDDDYIDQPSDVLLIYAGATYADGKMWSVNELRGQWWGPVTPPWEAQADG